MTKPFELVIVNLDLYELYRVYQRCDGKNTATLSQGTIDILQSFFCPRQLRIVRIERCGNPGLDQTLQPVQVFIGQIIFVQALDGNGTHATANVHANSVGADILLGSKNCTNGYSCRRSRSSGCPKASQSCTVVTVLFESQSRQLRFY